jgi:SAM-dependent methyltransferase
MKLSQLVNYYNQLCQHTARTSCQLTKIELDKIRMVSDDAMLDQLQAEIIDSFNRFELHLDQLKANIKEQISQLELPYLQESYQVYQEILDHKYQCYDHQNEDMDVFIQTSLQARLHVSSEAIEYINNRIRLYADWQKTTMILRPGLETWINLLTSNDPLYLVDDSHDLLAPAVTQFNTQYQQRLRKYVIRESLDHEILKDLPNGQFGLVLAYNYFDRKPFEYIQCYLKEIYVKLKPGGTLLMTYNDCDRWQGVLASESRSALYTPGSLILDSASNLGFETSHSWHENGSWTWLELRKPGEWKSIRGGQALAKILPKQS